MTTNSSVNKAAPLKNVAAFTTLIEKVVERRPDLPGMACFSGPSGLGKTKSAIYGANRYRAAYVECNQYTSAKSLLTSILKELGDERPRGTVTDLIDQAVMRMAADPKRPIIVDEAHYVADKKFVDVLRTISELSTAPVILIGEETLPTHLVAFERVHNRILAWVQAVPLDMEDFWHLAKVACPGIEISEDLAKSILATTKGNTRRTVVNLAHVEETANSLGVEAIDLATFSSNGEFITGIAPLPRRVA